MRRLSENEVEFYDTNGYLVLNGILNKNECEKAITVFESYADNKFSAIMNLDRKDSLVREIAILPEVVDSVEQLQRWEVDYVMSQMLFKKAGSEYRLQAWNPHQDNSYPQIPYPLNVTTNLFLTDADRENGGMYIYPRSQREPLVKFAPTVSHRETPGTNPGNTIEVPDRYKKMDLTVQAGSVLVMNSHLMHGSYPNNSETRDRPLFSVSYVSKGVEVPFGVNAKRIRFPVRPFPAIHFKR